MQIITLYEREEPKEQFLTPELQRLYGGDLYFPEPHSNRPYVIANFVETIDGVVSFRIPGRSGHPACRRREAQPGFRMERENLDPSSTVRFTK